MSTIAPNEIWAHQRLLELHERVPRPKLNRSFLDISGYPHYENVCSNILAFFFQPDNEHGLGNLMLRAFFAALDLDSDLDGSFGVVSVEREVGSDGMRLDLVVECPGFVIGIENKIGANLHNDLGRYSRFIDKRSRIADATAVKVILTLKPLPAGTSLGDFRALTYEALFSQIKANLGRHVQVADLKYLAYLNDFMRTLESLRGGVMENKESWTFFKDNWEKIDSLMSDYNRFREALNQRIPQLWSLVKVPESETRVRQWIYAKSCLVNDFQFSDGVIAVDTCILPSGWAMTLFARRSATKNRRDEVAKSVGDKLGISLIPSATQAQRLVAGEFSLDENLDTVAGRLRIIIEEMLRMVP